MPPFTRSTHASSCGSWGASWGVPPRWTTSPMRCWRTLLPAALGVLFFLDAKSFPGFLTAFLLLFVTAGIGNGSTFRMIPAIFRAERLHELAAAGQAGDEAA